MSRLKKENAKKCFSLLEEFIQHSQEEKNKKGAALLALGHLQRITAGAVPPSANCYYRPRADLSPSG